LGILVHEMSIVQALIEQVDAEVEQSSHEGRVTGVDLVIGRMSGVHVDSLRFAFGLLTPGTTMEGAVLRIEEPAPTLECFACGEQRVIEEMLLDCPACGSHEVSIQGGQDLLLQSIELADEG